MDSSRDLGVDTELRTYSGPTGAWSEVIWSKIFNASQSLQSWLYSEAVFGTKTASHRKNKGTFTFTTF